MKKRKWTIKPPERSDEAKKAELERLEQEKADEIKRLNRFRGMCPRLFQGD